MNFAVPADLKVKLKKQVPRPCLRTEKTAEHESDGDTNYNWCSWYCPQRIGTRTQK